MQLKHPLSYVSSTVVHNEKRGMVVKGVSPSIQSLGRGRNYSLEASLVYTMTSRLARTT